MLVAINAQTDMPIEGCDAEKGPDYKCQMCGELVTLKKGMVMVHHFSHVKGSDCSHGCGETKYHRTVKNAIANHLRSIGHDVRVEWKITHEYGDKIRIADVADLTDKRIYEVQHSPQNEDDLRSRTAHYMKANFFTTWVLPWKPKDDYGGVYKIFPNNMIKSLYAIDRKKPLWGEVIFSDIVSGEVFLFGGIVGIWMVQTSIKAQNTFSGPEPNVEDMIKHFSDKHHHYRIIITDKTYYHEQSGDFDEKEIFTLAEAWATSISKQYIGIKIINKTQLGEYPHMPISSLHKK